MVHPKRVILRSNFGNDRSHGLQLLDKELFFLSKLGHAVKTKGYLFPQCLESLSPHLHLKSHFAASRFTTEDFILDCY